MLLVFTGCSSTFDVAIRNDSGGGPNPFTVTSIEVWSDGDGCTGENVLEGTIRPGATERIEGVALPGDDVQVSLCIATSAGNVDPSDIEGAGWNVDAGCTLDLSLSWDGYAGFVSYIGGPTDCPDDVDLE